MKTRLVIFLFSACAFLFSNKADAQVILDNQTPVGLNIFVNDVPVGTCGFTGVGAPIYVPPFTVVSLPPALGWVVGYGIDNGASAPVVVGEPTCGYPAVRVGYLGAYRLEYRGNVLLML